VPPPGSRKVRSLPKSLHLNAPFTTIGSPRFIDVHALWVSTKPVESVRTYLETHRPPGSRSGLSGELGGPGGSFLWSYGFEWPAIPNLADERELLVEVVARPGGGSAFRADAQATYVEPKPRGQSIPAGAGFLEAEELLGAKLHKVGTSNAAKIEATARLID